MRPAHGASSRIGDLGAGVLGGQGVFDAADRLVGAHERDHTPQSRRARCRGSRSRVGITVAQRRERGRDRVYAGHGRIGGNQRLGHVDLPGS